MDDYNPFGKETGIPKAYSSKFQKFV